MVLKWLLLVGYFYFFFSCHFAAIEGQNNPNPNNASIFTATFNGASSSAEDSDCCFSKSQEANDEDSKVKNPSVVLKLNHLSSGKKIKNPFDSLLESTAKDLTRIQSLHTRILEKNNQKTVPRLKQPLINPIIPPSAPPEYSSNGFSGHLIATLESGVSLGSGEYFMDVFVGTPPKHFSLILDTGSDLSWIQCVPCHDCFDQTGPYYNPNESSSFRNISCDDPRCGLVSSPEPRRACENQSCPYYYWYGDSSNTTGDFAVETFTVNLTTAPDGRSEFRKVENVMFGCGHWNRGLFHGAAGILGLGRGPLSFSSQLQSLYGHSFSYCLVDRNSNSSVSSKLVFGEDEDVMSNPDLNFTALVGGNDSSIDTFYYVKIESVVVGGEVLDIPNEIWDLSSSDGGGGTIVDSGTTLSYFADPGYKIIKEAFVRKVKGYPVVRDFPVLDPCYNVSGVDRLDLPPFGIVFGDGAVWNFPVENYFIKIEPDDVVCLAILGTPRSGLSIIGNYQQQNFHVLYDTKRSRLGFAPAKCADV